MTSWLELLFTLIAFGGFIVIATFYKPGGIGGRDRKFCGQRVARGIIIG